MLMFLALPIIGLGRWIATVQEGYLDDWEGQERKEMTLLLLNLRRNAFPDTYCCDLLRRAAERYRIGMPVETAFSRFRGDSGLFKIFFFSAEGKRVVPTGFIADYRILSENVMRGILKTVRFKNEEDSQTRRVSNQFFGSPRSLGWIAESPRVLVNMPRGSGIPQRRMVVTFQQESAGEISKGRRPLSPPKVGNQKPKVRSRSES